MAVVERNFSATCPCMAVVEFGANMVGRKDAVLNNNRTVRPTHKATVATAVFALKATVELTIAEYGFGVGGIYNGYEATVSGITIHAAVDGHRRTATLYGDSTSCNNLSDET